MRVLIGFVNSTIEEDFDLESASPICVFRVPPNVVASKPSSAMFRFHNRNEVKLADSAKVAPHGAMAFLCNIINISFP